MDSRIGLDYIVENKDYTTKLAAGNYIKKYFKTKLGLRFEKSDNSYLNRFFLKFIKIENAMVAMQWLMLRHKNKYNLIIKYSQSFFSIHFLSEIY